MACSPSWYPKHHWPWKRSGKLIPTMWAPFANWRIGLPSGPVGMPLPGLGRLVRIARAVGRLAILALILPRGLSLASLRMKLRSKSRLFWLP